AVLTEGLVRAGLRAVVVHRARLVHLAALGAGAAVAVAAATGLAGMRGTGDGQTQTDREQADNEAFHGRLSLGCPRLGKLLIEPFVPVTLLFRSRKRL